MAEEEEDPFDSVGGNVIPPPKIRKSSLSVPPSSAFAAFKIPHAITATPEKEKESSTTAFPPAPVTPEERLPARWKQYDKETPNAQKEFNLAASRSTALSRERNTRSRYLQKKEDQTDTSGKQKPYTNFGNFETASSSGLGPRRPYSFNRNESYDSSKSNYDTNELIRKYSNNRNESYDYSKSNYDTKDLLRKYGGDDSNEPYDSSKSSYDTNELLRKYGAMTGITPSAESQPTTSSFNSPSFTTASVTKPSATTRSISTPSAMSVRDEAMKILDVVDDHLAAPLDLHTTESGGLQSDLSNSQEDAFEDEPYILASARNTGGRRVPAALSGINFSNKKGKRPSWQAGRRSFTDPSFRDDDLHLGEDEDIFMHRGADEQEVETIEFENRSKGLRATSDGKKFPGDFPGKKAGSWSSRYLDFYANQTNVMDQWDDEFKDDKKSTPNMFMVTARKMSSAATNAWSGVQSQTSKIFGSGFSFRKNHIYGNHGHPEVNLRTVWKDVTEEDVVERPRVHRTWQKALLNKRRRRRALTFLVLCILVTVSVVVVSKIVTKKQSKIKYGGGNIGSSVTFYVTSDVPYDEDGEDKLVKDLANLATDAEFAVHLGNIQDSKSTFCPASTYTGVASLLKKSPVPLFITPGAEDWATCPNHETSLTHWMDSFLRFDNHFDHGMRVFRDIEHPEAFAFVKSGVLFLGLHIVHAPIVDEDAWSAREKQMISFYYGMTQVNKGTFRAMVILANSGPSPQQEKFFDSVVSSLKSIDRPMVYIHANSGSGLVREYNPFKENKSVEAIEVESGGVNPPLRITVGFGNRPFIVG